ncbi:MAG: CAP domain-containing protein, partial [Solirubrobacterales bacterium]
MPDFDASVICLINEQRAANNMKPLRPNELLQDSAYIYVTSQLSGEFFSHDGSVDGRPDLSNPIKRLRFLGYIPPGKRWIVGEDLRQATLGTDTPAGVVQAWMNSLPHRAEILKA